MRQLPRSTVLLALAALLLLLAACGGDGAEETSGTGASADGDAEAAGEAAEITGDITVWIMDPGSDELRAVVDGYAADFETENEGTSVAVEYIPWSGGKDRFITAISSGEVPDLAEAGTTWTPEFAALGGLEPVTEEDPDWLPSLVEAATFQGEIDGLPWYAGTRALIYRADIFEELGLQAPTTWDEVDSVAETIQAERPGIFPMLVPGDYLHMLLPMVWQAGGDLASLDGDQWVAEVDSEAGRAAFETYARWHSEYSPEGTLNQNEAEARTVFDEGEAAMFVGGPWDVTDSQANNPDLEGNLATALLPEGPGGSQDTFAGGSHLVVFREAANPEGGHAFREFMLRPENLVKFTDELGFFAGTRSGIDESTLLDDPLMESFGMQLRDHSRVYPVTPNWGQLETQPQPSTVAVQQLIGGEATVDEVLEQLNAEIEAALNR